MANRGHSLCKLCSESYPDHALVPHLVPDVTSIHLRGSTSTTLYHPIRIFKSAPLPLFVYWLRETRTFSELPSRCTAHSVIMYVLFHCHLHIFIFLFIYFCALSGFHYELLNYWTIGSGDEISRLTCRSTPYRTTRSVDKPTLNTLLVQQEWVVEYRVR